MEMPMAQIAQDVQDSSVAACPHLVGSAQFMDRMPGLAFLMHARIMFVLLVG